MSRYQNDPEGRVAALAARIMSSAWEDLFQLGFPGQQPLIDPHKAVDLARELIYRVIPGRYLGEGSWLIGTEQKIKEWLLKLDFSVGTEFTLAAGDVLMEFPSDARKEAV